MGGNMPKTLTAIAVMTVLCLGVVGCTGSPAPDARVVCNVDASFMGMSYSVCLDMQCDGPTCAGSVPTCSSLADEINRGAGSEVMATARSTSQCSGTVSGTRSGTTEDGNVMSLECYSTDAAGAAVCMSFNESDG
jgi:hypothetical protein